VTHALITPEGVARVKQAPLDEMIVTDSLPAKDWGGFPVDTVPVGELLAEAILRIHNNQSVTSLFRV
jgi:ribose-phosphate pyrophosphokinase